jgi:3-dehydroquinate dehydratase I
MLKVRDIVIGEGMPKIIVPLVGTTEQALREEIKTLKNKKPDIFEWRVDMFDMVMDLPSIEKTLSIIREHIGDIPLLFTFRTVHEGGKQEVPLDYYSQLVKNAILSGQVDLIDIELFLGDIYVKELLALAKKSGAFVVLSNHDFQKTPAKDELITRFQKMRELGADIPKIAVMPNKVQDVITLLDASQTIHEAYGDLPFIMISMGKQGLISRLAGEWFGSAATFASGVEQSAPGQIGISELREMMEILHQNRK